MLGQIVTDNRPEQFKRGTLAFVTEHGERGAGRQYSSSQGLSCLLTLLGQNELAHSSVPRIGNPFDETETLQPIDQAGYLGRVAADRLREGAHRGWLPEPSQGSRLRRGQIELGGDASELLMHPPV